MAVTDDRILPLAEIRVAYPGQGDPVMDDTGARWYDILRESWGFGTISRDSSGEATLEYVEGIGLVCRPFLVLKDTRLSQYTVSPSSNSWAERKPATGTPRVYRLVQYDTTAGVQWTAASNFPLPQNPQVAMGFVFPDSPPDWDPTTLSPYVRVEFGGGLWALEFSQTGGARLSAWDVSTGLFQPVQELNQPPNFAAAGGPDEVLVLLRVLRGKICVSTDYGRSYTVFGLPDGSPITVASSSYTVRGQGGACIFGLHQLLYKTGQYTSPTRGTYGPRSVLAGSPSLTGSYSTPTNTSVVFADRGTPLFGISQYRATLTPSTVLGTPFTFYRTPELYAVRTVYLPVLRLFSGMGFFALPLDSQALSIDITKPHELDCATCQVEARKDASTQPAGLGRWAKVQVWLGELSSAGAPTWRIAFTGYLKEETVRQQEFGKAFIRLELESASIRPKRIKWGALCPDTTPLGGQTVNAALDECLLAMGLNTGYRIWHAAGDAITLPFGLAEDPCFWPKATDTIWSTMQDIAEFAGLELGVNDTGQYFCVAKDYVDGFVSALLQALPTGDVRYGVKGGSYSVNYQESATRVLVRGKDAYGRDILAFGVDGTAEGFTLNDRFCPWPEAVIEDVDGTGGLPMLMQKVRCRMIDTVPLKGEAELTTPVNLDLLRRQQVQVSGLFLGFSLSDRFWVSTIRHTYRADPSFTTCETTVGLRRIFP